MKNVLGKIFLAITFTWFFSFQVLAFDSACSRPTELTCDYYANCVENYLPCGSKGYALGYGKLYCQRFLDTSYTTYQADLWRDETLLCLQRELSLFVFFSPYEIKSCSNIKKNAYESHADCYVHPNRSHPELSICYLSPADLKLTTQNIKAVDMLRWRGLKQMSRVARLCLELLSKNRAIPNSYGVSTEQQKALWQSMLKIE